jgi:hypothetical protein
VLSGHIADVAWPGPAAAVCAPNRLAAAVPVPVAVALTWRAHLAPADPASMDLVLDLPLLDTTRARDELGWVPRRSATDAVRELLDGIAEGAGSSTAPLAPDSAAGRLRELAGGVGERP